MSTDSEKVVLPNGSEVDPSNIHRVEKDKAGDGFTVHFVKDLKACYFDSGFEEIKKKLLVLSDFMYLN